MLTSFAKDANPAALAITGIILLVYNYAKGFKSEHAVGSVARFQAFYVGAEAYCRGAMTPSAAESVRGRVPGVWWENRVPDVGKFFKELGVVAPPSHLGGVPLWGLHHKTGTSLAKLGLQTSVPQATAVAAVSIPQGDGLLTTAQRKVGLSDEMAMDMSRSAMVPFQVVVAAVVAICAIAALVKGANMGKRAYDRLVKRVNLHMNAFDTNKKLELTLDKLSVATATNKTQSSQLSAAALKMQRQARSIETQASQLWEATEKSERQAQSMVVIQRELQALQEHGVQLGNSHTLLLNKLNDVTAANEKRQRLNIQLREMKAALAVLQGKPVAFLPDSEATQRGLVQLKEAYNQMTALQEAAEQDADVMLTEAHAGIATLSVAVKSPAFQRSVRTETDSRVMAFWRAQATFAASGTGTRLHGASVTLCARLHEASVTIGACPHEASATQSAT
jgi:hypothetical protein